MFIIPNKADATHVRQAGVYSADIDTLAAALAGDGVISGLGVAAQGSPDMTVAVAAGLLKIGGFYAWYNGGNGTITAANATNDRIDLVVVDRNNAMSVVAGTAAIKPVCPAVPANSIALAQVYVPANDTAIQNAQIYDKRPIIPDNYDFSAEFLGSSLSNTVATSAGSIGEAGWTMSGTTASPAFQTGVANHPGILRSITGGTSGNNTRFHFGNAANTGVLLATEIGRQRYVVRIPTITTMTAKLGAGVDLSVATVGQLGTAGAWIEFVPASSGQWRYCTRAASTTTANVDVDAAVNATAWYDFQIIRKQNGNIQFLKNNALMFEHTTNLPTVAVNVGTAVHTLTAAARNIDHDFFGFNLSPLGNRF